MNIRDARLEDLPAMLDIYNDAIVHLTATFDIKEQSIEERTVWFHQFNEDRPLIVAEVDGEIGGYCGISPYNYKDAYAKTVEISIYLSSKFRGKGIGGALMKEIIDRAKKLNYHSIIAKITEGNEGSIRLHEKFGFEYCGRLKEVGFKFGQWQNSLYYQLLLE